MLRKGGVNGVLVGVKGGVGRVIRVIVYRGSLAPALGPGIIEWMRIFE